MKHTDLYAIGSRGRGGLESDGSYDLSIVVDRLRKYLGTLPHSRLDTDRKRKEVITAWFGQSGISISGMSHGAALNALIDEVCNYGILTAAMEDPEVFEIRSNGRMLKVEKNGQLVDYTDSQGHLLYFKSVEEQDVVIRTLMQDKRLTPKDQLVNSQTLEGFRIAAVHSSAMGVDVSDAASKDRYSSFVLRKFSKVRYTLNDLCEGGTFSPEIKRFLELLIPGGITFVTVGPTASGKTTTNNAILGSCPRDLRVVLAQNPSEIDMRYHDPSTGLVMNDVLHLEAHEDPHATGTTATMQNIMDHILRLSPTLVTVGEIRTNEEFFQGFKILQAGHPMNCTYHAEDGPGAVWRFAVAYMAAAGLTDSGLALRQICDLVHIVIVQRLMPDKRRRIASICAVLGVNEDGTEPVVVPIFEYKMFNAEYDSRGMATKFDYAWEMVNPISEHLRKRLEDKGLNPELYADFVDKKKL
jgi:pilus assembly protein CpaF